MSDDERDIRALLEAEAERGPRPQGLRGATIRRGMGRRLSVVALPLLVVASVAWVAVAQPFASDPGPKVVGPGPGSSSGQIVFSRWATGGNGFYVVNGDGSDLHQIVDGGGPYAHDYATWSPDGTKIAFRGYFEPARGKQGGVFVTNADGSDRQLIARGGTGPTWGPSSDELIYAEGGTAYRTHVPPLHRAPEAIPINQEIDHVDWSPLGDRLAFSLAGIYVVPIEGGQPTKVVGGRSFYPGDPQWSPDGRQVAFTEYLNTPSEKPTRDGAEGASNELGEGVEDPIPMVSIIDISTGQIRQLTAGLSPTWAPDGTRVAFERADGTNTSHIYSINVDGTDEQQLTFGDVADHSPDWGAVPPQEEDPNPTEALYEEIPEQFKAEVFAFRALAATGLMDPYGARTYNWTYENDTTEAEGSWRVGFAASDCEPKGTTQTCTGLSGEDPELGNALTDTYVTVALQNGQWQVLYVEGNMPPDDVKRLEGFTLPDEAEPSHWDFASVAVLEGEGEDLGFAMTPIWVGPYPTQARGSVCEITGVDADGNEVGRTTVRYFEPPNREFERGGWVASGGAELPPEAVDAEVTCEQYAGPGWEVAGEPEVQGAPGEVMGVSIPLEWHGPEGFIAPASCDAALVDESGEVVWEGTERLEGMGPPPNPKDYPYRSAVFIHTGGETIDAQEVGEFSCRTL